MTVYTLFGQPATPATVATDTNPYTFGVQFSSSASGTATGIWFYSPPGGGVITLPDHIAIYAVSGTSLVHSEAASWSGAAASGWVKASFSSPPSLSASTSYKACVLNANPQGNNWYSRTSLYWSSGAGSGGITSGVLTAPNNAGGDGGQDTYNASSTLTYPASSFNAANYWVDIEFTTSGGVSHNAQASLTVTPTLAAVARHDAAAALTVAPHFAVVTTQAHHVTAALVVTPRFANTRTGGQSSGAQYPYHHRASNR